MARRKRGVRKYFSRPLKGCKVYGRLKRWRNGKSEATSASCGTELIGLDSNTAPPHDPSLVPVLNASQMSYDSQTDGFPGFDVPPLEASNIYHRRGIRVLSLFDGISTAYYTLRHKLNIDVDAYYASEICPNAIRIQKQNFGEYVICIGSVTTLTPEKLDELGQIDLLIGGSPCEELSLANPRRKGVLDKAGSGYLFFEYVRILRYLEMKAKERYPFFWLFENTTKMEIKDREVINRSLGCDPSVHNAATFVPMERARYFWGNIPFLSKVRVNNRPVPPLQDFLRPFRTATTQTLPTVTTKTSSQRRRNCFPPVLEDGVYGDLWPIELEVLFGLPEHFTAFGLSDTRRKSLLGKSWSVHVIEALLQPLTLHFKVRHWSN